MESVPFQLLNISAVREESPGVKTFFLEPENPAALPCRPGQFLTFLFHSPAGPERRSYSISSCPEAGAPLAITVKRVENGRYSRWLIDHAVAGDRLRCLGAAGLFTLPEDLSPYRQVLLFAAGIGITPIYSLLKSLLQMAPGISLVLVYSNRSEMETVFLQELRALQAAHPGRLRIEWLFSNAKNLARARFSKELMPALLRTYWDAPPEATLCFSCGPFDYMWLVSLLLQEAGIPPGNIRKEIFYHNKPAPRKLPPDQDLHKVRIQTPFRTYELQVQFPESILQAAKRQGIPLPFSCEAGQCSSCALPCLRGRVWMSANEVLTDNDLSAGIILTCTGHPVGGEVLLGWGGVPLLP